MEVVIKDEVDKKENHLTSAAAFVEGGIQEACDDSCSICLEAFCDNDPSTVTSCKHEFHLQCILEWCQRSSNCPMCWQPISLKDPSSQELLEAVEQERNIRSTPARNATIFHHPTLGDFELQHLPVGVNDTELEERIIQHLAAAAAMGRSHHVARRGSRTRSSAHGRPEFLMFSTHANAPSSSPVSGPLPPIEDNNNNSSRPFNDDSLEYMPPHFSSVQNNQLSGSSSGSLNTQRSLPAQATSQDQDQPGPSDLQSISDTWKSRFNSMSTKYKESIAKSTKGWKEKLFSRSTSMAEIGSEVRREMNAGLASVSRMMERLETRDNNNNNNNNNIAGPGPGPQNNVVEPSITEQRNRDDIDNNHDESSRNNDNSSVISTTSSVSR